MEGCDEGRAWREGRGEGGAGMEGRGEGGAGKEGVKIGFLFLNYSLPYPSSFTHTHTHLSPVRNVCFRFQQTGEGRDLACQCILENAAVESPRLKPFQLQDTYSFWL